MKISKENYFDKLKDLNADGIKPTFIAAVAECLLREDQVTPSLPEKEDKKNAPKREQGYFDEKIIYRVAYAREEILPLKNRIAEP